MTGGHPEASLIWQGNPENQVLWLTQKACEADSGLSGVIIRAKQTQFSAFLGQKRGSSRKAKPIKPNLPSPAAAAPTSAILAHLLRTRETLILFKIDIYENPQLRARLLHCISQAHAVVPGEEPG
ncbi:MAG: hypothetical protein JSW27_09945 [Phycisphaerales bacterium]|nr:MAG: hypothetical protein JSW27_09945 [Phycisphaerales bacterium]